MRTEGPIRLLADDLTGALDTGAQFTAQHGALDVVLTPQAARRGGALAFDCGSRDQSQAAARDMAQRLGGFFAGAGIAMRKIDTLMRGHTFAETALSYRLGGFRSTIFAPAFPAQGRLTRGGRQWARQGDGLRDVAGDLVARLAEYGLMARHAAGPDQIAGHGAFVCDAETQDDLSAIVAAGRRLEGPVLWVGAAGLGRALGGRAARAGIPPAPLLLIVGSPHEVAGTQLRALDAACPGAVTYTTDPADATPLDLSRGLTALGFAFDGLDRVQAAQQIRAAIAARLTRMPPPAGLCITGGETLRATAEILGATGLSVTGEVQDGLPASRLIGGRWMGTPVLSKSGAFGGPDTFTRLLAGAFSQYSGTPTRIANAPGDTR